MKKTMMQLAVTVMVLACATAVFAANLTSGLWAFQINGVPNANLQQNIAHVNGHGWMTFKTARGGGWDVSVQLLSGAPRFTYIVRSNGIPRGIFTTDKKGNGVFTFHVKDASIPVLGDSINIWAAFNHFSDGSVDMTYLLWCATNPIQ